VHKGVSGAWKAGRIPIADAITFGDGRMLLLELITQENGPDQIRSVEETTFDAFLARNPGWLADVTPVVEIDIPSRGILQAGEGSQGADGFIALADKDGELVYCVFCTSSNPFRALAIGEDGATVRAVTTADVEWSFHIDSPWFITTRFDKG